MCLSHLIYTVRPCLIHTCHAAPMPSTTMPFFSRPRHSRPSRDGLWATCSCSASSGYHAEFHEVIRRIPISDAGSQCETKHRLHGWGKSGGSTLQKKTICYNVGLAVRIFPATMRTFTKYAALSEQGRGAAWHVWINARHGRGTAWARHAMCESVLRLYKRSSPSVHLYKNSLYDAVQRKNASELNVQYQWEFYEKLIFH